MITVCPIITDFQTQDANDVDAVNWEQTVKNVILTRANVNVENLLLAAPVILVRMAGGAWVYQVVNNVTVILLDQ